MPIKICMLVTNPVSNDPRVRREALTLTEAGYEVVVIGAAAEGYREAEWMDGFRVIRLHQSNFFLSWLQKTAPRLYQTLRHLRRPTLLVLWLKDTSPNLYERLRRLYRSIRKKPDADSHTSGMERNPVMPGPPAPRGFLSKLNAERREILSMIWFNLALAEEAVRHAADVCHAHDLDTLLAGSLVKRRTGKQLVYDFHELYTEQFRKGTKTWAWRLYYSLLEGILAKRADQALTVCDSLGTWVSQRYGVKSVITLKNVPAYQSVPRVTRTGRRDRVILYHGGYFRDRGLEQLIESAQYVEGGRIVLRGYGDCEDQLRTLVKAKGLEDRVSFAAPVPMTDLVRAASEADIGVAPFLPVCLNTQFCLPNKLFEYLMAGLAVASVDLPEMRRIVLGHHVGVLFEPHDPRDIARALNSLLGNDADLEKMKDNARRAAQLLYNWEKERHVLVKLYGDLVSA